MHRKKYKNRENPVCKLRDVFNEKHNGKLLKSHQSFYSKQQQEAANVLALSMFFSFSKRYKSKGPSLERYVEENSTNDSMQLLLCSLQMGIALGGEETLGTSRHYDKSTIIQSKPPKLLASEETFLFHPLPTQHCRHE